MVVCLRTHYKPDGYGPAYVACRIMSYIEVCVNILPHARCLKTEAVYSWNMAFVS